MYDTYYTYKEARDERERERTKDILGKDWMEIFFFQVHRYDVKIIYILYLDFIKAFQIIQKHICILI